jgi:CRP/FNR family transcriptional regulator/CRP/FNR family cyclic AMP-dependent transcriptional regulator
MAALPQHTQTAGLRDGAFAAAAPQGILEQVGERERRAIMEAGRVRRFKTGEALFHEGDPGHSVYFLRAGQVKIVQIAPDGAETILHYCGSGECVGEMALMDGQPRSATAVALEPVETLALRREDFLEFLARHPSVALAMLHRVIGIVRRLNDEMQTMLSLDATGRIARKLLELAEQHGQSTPRGLDVGVRISQDQLAQMVGAARSTVNKQLGWFQEHGILTLERERIYIHQPEQLRKRIY